MSQEKNQLQTILDSKNDIIISQIIEQEDSKQVTDLVNLFNLNHMKKQLLRTLTYDQLLDHIMNQMEDRVTKRADQFSNKDLLDYMNVMGAAMDKAQKQFGDVQAIPQIQINQQNNIVNVNNNDASDNLDRESRRKVMDAVSSILNKLKNNSQDIANQEVDLVYLDDDTSNNEEESDEIIYEEI